MKVTFVDVLVIIVIISMFVSIIVAVRRSLMSKMSGMWNFDSNNHKYNYNNSNKTYITDDYDDDYDFKGSRTHLDPVTSNPIIDDYTSLAYGGIFKNKDW